MEKKELRICAYDPEKDLITVQYDEKQPAELYLEVKNRVFWFNKYCEEKGLRGLIDESQIQFVPEMNMVAVTAKVFIDDKLVAAAVAGRPFVPGDNENNCTLIQTVATTAKGRALADAGFGTIGASIPAEDGVPFPVDAGVKLTRSQSNPMSFEKQVLTEPASTVPLYIDEIIKTVDDPAPTASEPAAVPAATVEAPAPAAPVKPAPAAPVKPAAAVPAEQGMTLEDARNYLAPIGKFKGKPVYQIIAEDMSLANWYAGESFDQSHRHAEFKKAVQIALGLA